MKLKIQNKGEKKDLKETQKEENEIKLQNNEKRAYAKKGLMNRKKRNGK